MKQVKGASFELNSQETSLATQYEHEEPKGVSAEGLCKYWSQRTAESENEHTLGLLKWPAERFQTLRRWSDAHREEACTIRDEQLKKEEAIKEAKAAQERKEAEAKAKIEAEERQKKREAAEAEAKAKKEKEDRERELAKQEETRKNREIAEAGCKKKDQSACADLAIHIVDTDAKKAFQLAEKSCKAKNARGCAILGSFYITGQGTVANFSKGQGLINASCEAGDAIGCELNTRLVKAQIDNAPAVTIEDIQLNGNRYEGQFVKIPRLEMFRFTATDANVWDFGGEFADSIHAVIASDASDSVKKRWIRTPSQAIVLDMKGVVKEHNGRPLLVVVDMGIAARK
jgi:membrane protein involved in colicin uptake